MPQQTGTPSRWTNAVRTLGALFAVAIVSIGLAAPAAASKDGYLQTLRTKYTYLSESRLLSEGSRVCSELGSGVPASDAVVMVYKDLGVSMSAAYEIVVSAVNHLGC